MVAHPAGKTSRGFCAIQAPRSQGRGPAILSWLRWMLPMSIRLRLLALTLLLSACASAPDSTPVTPATPPAAAPSVSPAPPVDTPMPLPAHLREISGRLLGAPSGAEVELALLQVDERGRPRKLLASLSRRADGTPLAFALRFNPEAFPGAARVELRGRASHSGRLILRLPPRTIPTPTNQVLGDLSLVPAP